VKLVYFYVCVGACFCVSSVRSFFLLLCVLPFDSWLFLSGSSLFSCFRVCGFVENVAGFCFLNYINFYFFLRFKVHQANNPHRYRFRHSHAGESQKQIYIRVLYIFYTNILTFLLAGLLGNFAFFIFLQAMAAPIWIRLACSVSSKRLDARPSSSVW